MTLVDLNVVLYAINTAAAHHVEARTWWESALNGDEPVGLAWSVVTGFLRLSTHAAALPRPLTVEQACRGATAGSASRRFVWCERRTNIGVIWNGCSRRPAPAGISLPTPISRRSRFLAAPRSSLSTTVFV